MSPEPPPSFNSDRDIPVYSFHDTHMVSGGDLFSSLESHLRHENSDKPE